MNWFFVFGMIGAWIVQIALNAMVMRRARNQDRIIMRHYVLLNAIVLHMPDELRQKIDKQIDEWGSQWGKH